MKANLLLSSGVALTGICVPIGLSYTLQGLLNATPVQAFAAGAALCSTSLGTTFTVLSSSGLSNSRLGVVLTTAAMMDDIVGLVMVQVISNLGGEKFNVVTVVRPVLVSIAFAVMVPVACLSVLRPVTLWLNQYREAHPTAALNDVLRREQLAFTLHTALLIALITSATYAGTSNLFAAYIAGATISWWDSEVPHIDVDTKRRLGSVKIEAVAANAINRNIAENHAGPSNREGDIKLKKAANCAQAPHPAQAADVEDKMSKLCGVAIYEQYYRQVVSKILQPLFFASIGFSIPITRMFRGAIIWRGIVYAVLMALGKIVCGLWLLKLSIAPFPGTVSRLIRSIKLPPLPHHWSKRQAGKTPTTASADATELRIRQPTASIDPPPVPASSRERRSALNPPKPLSLHPPLILALAMCARGEIGFLISGVAESNSIFSGSRVASSDPSDMFLVVTWAIVLCTIIGPLGVGLSVRRVKKLQVRKDMQQEGTGRDVLGVWGVE